MNRRFLNMVVENIGSGLFSLRRLGLSNNLFYPSAAAAETAMARTEEAIKANAERQSGYKHGLRFLQTMATSLGSLPAATINYKGSGTYVPGDVPMNLFTLMGHEDMIFCADCSGYTSLYDADSHSVVAVPPLRAYKGRETISLCIPRADGGAENQGGLFVMSRVPDADFSECCFEELRFNGGEDFFTPALQFADWDCLPQPPFILDPAYTPADIGAYTVVGGSTICISSPSPGNATYCFDTKTWTWYRAGNWMLPFFGRAEYAPELGVWFGLSADRPFHLCACDLSRLDFERPPAVLGSWVDLDMPKSWSPYQLDLIHLGGGKFCVVKIFHSTQPRFDEDCSDEDDDEAMDYRDMIDMEFAVLTGIEMVRYDDGVHPCKIRMIKHKSRFHIFHRDVIHFVF